MVTFSADASDNVGVVGVQFKLDGVNLSAEDTAAPYAMTWDSTTASNGTHTVTAVARDGVGNRTVSAPVVVTVNNPLDTTPDAFNFPPQTGSALNTAVTSNTITPAGYNTAAVISVSAGGSYSINGGAFVTSAGTLSPGQTVAVRLTTSASNSTQTCTTLTIGGVAGQFCATTQGTIIAGGQDFATRCAQPGVVKCVGFDTASDIAGVFGNNSGILPGETTPTLDGTVKASGNSSLKFTIPSNSGANSSGAYFTNFSSDLSVQFGENSEFFVQWRQRFSPEFINTHYTSANGWKQLIMGTGDQPGTLYSSCSTLETVVQNTGQAGFAQMYNSCTGSTSHIAFDNFYTQFGSYDFKLQNARPSPYCLYSQSGAGHFLPTGNCFGYFPDEWMTFQVRVKTGPRVADEFTNSFVELWIGREGQPSEMVINQGPYNLSAGSAAENQRFGKVWLLPYNTNKDSTQVHPTGYTWYDELIISRNRIEDPSLTQAPPPDTTPDAFSFTAQTSVAPGTAVTSNTVTPAGYNAAAPISVSGGSYSINGGAFVATAGTINPGQTVALRMTAAGTFSTTSSASLMIGGTVASFSVTTQAGGSPPSAPTGVSASSRIGAIVVRFGAPTSAGSSPIVAYTATCVPNNGGVSVSSVGDATATSILIGGLINGKTYACTVSASNSIGNGPSSAPSNTVTPIDISPLLNLWLED
jgi:hypothetical protein